MYQGGYLQEWGVSAMLCVDLPLLTHQTSMEYSVGYLTVVTSGLGLEPPTTMDPSGMRTIDEWYMRGFDRVPSYDQV